MEDSRELEDLKQKVKKIEYTEIKEIKDDIQHIKIDLNTNNILTQQCTESNERLSNTLDSLKLTMVEVSQSMKDSNKVTSELALNVRDLNSKLNDVEKTMDTKFNEVNGRMDTIDEKSKIDFIDVLRTNWIGIAMGAGALIYALSQIGINLQEVITTEQYQAILDRLTALEG